MERLTPDMVEEILQRVPTRPLALCKCVCKPWNHIIKSPSFNQAQFKLVVSGDVKLVDESEFIVALERSGCISEMYLLGRKKYFKNCPSFSLSSENFNGRVFMSGSAKGFLCLSAEVGESEYLYWVYNPVTEECVQLPKYSFGMNENNVMTFHMGFGFVDSTNEVKVVKIFGWIDEERDHEQFKVHVCTLGSSSWRTIECPINFIIIKLDGAVLLNGLLHWLCVYYEEEEPTIVAFDLKSEKFSFICIPVSMASNPDFRGFYIGVLDGCLYIGDNSFEDRIEIWVMKSYNVDESWTKIISVRKHISTKLLLDFSTIHPIVWRKNGEILLLCDNHFLCSYNPENGKRKRVNHKPLLDLQGGLGDLMVYPYTPTTFHLKQYTEWRGNVENGASKKQG